MTVVLFPTASSYEGNSSSTANSTKSCNYILHLTSAIYADTQKLVHIPTFPSILTFKQLHLPLPTKHASNLICFKCGPSLEAYCHL